MNAPIALCRVEPCGTCRREHWVAIVIQCPICGRQHEHGAGLDGTVLGHRLAHCGGDLALRSSGYVLVRGD